MADRVPGSAPWVIQSFLPGIPTPELLALYPKATHGAFFRQMGEITAFTP
ncbi:hypothetical protein KPP03845_100094 [Streptomyces xanthophaeus]|nr:hypothetical protein [Streptomyces xanthophaeus]WCD83775.1 hypothetical protein KPP03845_100094 [Streptomyces xanthophaeus]